jgi:hypothetical protein
MDEQEACRARRVDAVVIAWRTPAEAMDDATFAITVILHADAIITRASDSRPGLIEHMAREVKASVANRYASADVEIEVDRIAASPPFEVLVEWTEGPEAEVVGIVVEMVERYILCCVE